MDEKAVVVSCRGICKSYGEGDTRVDALIDIDFDFYKGQLSIIRGRSGSGKTTLVSIMVGFLQQDKGECLILGQDLSKLSSLEKALFRSHRIGFVYQNHRLVPTLTALENVSLPLIVQNIDEAIAEAKAEELLHALGLEGRGHHFPKELSLGQQQRVGIARALITDPELVFCDEPTSALDVHAVDVVLTLLKDRVQQKGQSVIIITHDTRVMSYGDHSIMLEDGRVIAESIKH
jgi:putative ABC transport system ATP-binding protein